MSGRGFHLHDGAVAAVQFQVMEVLLPGRLFMHGVAYGCAVPAAVELFKDECHELKSPGVKAAQGKGFSCLERFLFERHFEKRDIPVSPAGVLIVCYGDDCIPLDRVCDCSSAGGPPDDGLLRVYVHGGLLCLEGRFCPDRVRDDIPRGRIDERFLGLAELSLLVFAYQGLEGGIGDELQAVVACRLY